MSIELDRAALGRALARVAQRDPKALEEVYQRTSAKLFGVCLRILKDRGEAEDVLQDVYLTVWNKAERFDSDRASPITWLAAMARNRAIDRLRAGTSRARTAPLEAADRAHDPAALADAALETSQALSQLELCLDALEPHHAKAVRTAFFEARTYDAMAREAGVPLGTMKGWIRRSLMRLKTCLEA